MKRKLSMGFILVTVMLLALAASPVFGGNGENGLQKAKEVQERHTARLLAINGVEGTAVGHGPNGRGAVLVLTATPGVKGIPDELDGVKVVAHVTGKFFALRPDLKPCGKGKNPTPCPPTPTPDPSTPTPTPEPASECTTTQRCERPVPIGVSTGHPDITAGTIGARVTDGTNVYALSN